MWLTTNCLPTFCIQEPWDAKIIVGNIEGVVKIFNVPRWLQNFEVNEVGTMSMDKGIEPKTITPWTCTHKQTSATNAHQEYKFMCIISFLMLYLWSPECWPQDTH